MKSGETEVRLPYGDSFLVARIPSQNLSYILERKETAAAFADESEAIRQSLRTPISSLPLVERLGKEDKVVVIATDNTRACPDHRLLPVLLEEIELKVPRHNITIITALGLHPPLDKKTCIYKYGAKIVENYRLINHDINRTVRLGITTRGTPIEVLEDVTRADFVISTGFIEPHFFAGFSGGRKSIAPGVSSPDSIRKNHSYPMIAHPNARAGVLEGNPVHEDMVEQTKAVGLDFILNVVLDKRCNITYVVAGDFIVAHEQGCMIEKEQATACIEQAADITVVTNGGSPLDLDLYQTAKAIDTASQITKKGGIIIAVSSCHMGMGPSAFCDLHRSASSPAEVIGRIQESETIGVQWQNQILARAQLDHKVFLVSGLKPDQIRGMMMEPVPTVEEGIARAISVLGAHASIAVIPDGPRTIPVISR